MVVVIVVALVVAVMVVLRKIGRSGSSVRRRRGSNWERVQMTAVMAVRQRYSST